MVLVRQRERGFMRMDLEVKCFAIGPQHIFDHAASKSFSLFGAYCLASSDWRKV